MAIELESVPACGQNLECEVWSPRWGWQEGLLMNDCLVNLVSARLVTCLIIVFLGFTLKVLPWQSWGGAQYSFPLSFHVILKQSLFKNR